MVQLQISNETMSRMEKITGISHARDGDFLVNQMIDILEKKVRVWSPSRFVTCTIDAMKGLQNP